MNPVIVLEGWCLIFALFVTISALASRPYPDNVRRWGGKSGTTVETVLNVFTMIAASVSTFYFFQIRIHGAAAADVAPF